MGVGERLYETNSVRIFWERTALLHVVTQKRLETDSDWPTACVKVCARPLHLALYIIDRTVGCGTAFTRVCAGVGEADGVYTGGDANYLA